jgi:predicted dehydrogenase
VGYETTFVNAAYDYLTALKEGKKISPNFADGVKILQTLEAAQKSAAEGRKVKVSEIK